MQDFTSRIATMSAQRLALLAMDLQERIERSEYDRSEPIAIVGAACRFPGAPDLESFGRLLRDGIDAVSVIPGDRWDLERHYSPDPDAPGKMYTRHGSFVEGHDRFDAEFFGISAREAESMDPQQRLLLEVAWEALENGGLPASELHGTETGVFVGISTSDYLQYGARHGGPEKIDAYLGTGCSPSVTAGRLSYTLGLVGPNYPVDTACSSSLVALHLACLSLRQRDCRVALAGGVNLMVIPETFIYFCKMRALSRDGRCKTFDAAADGYGRGEGCGMVVLKRLSDAEADGDSILALIRGSDINHDGRSNGLTVRNGLAQERVIAKALANARVEPHEVSYIEAHGTGTALGDPIELHALGNVLRERRDSGPCGPL
jgi:acyl transferase domain-containing protein